MTKRPKRANLKPPGRCIFCGAFGLTQEHMWADWLRAYIPRTAAEHRTRSLVAHLDSDETSVFRRTGDPHSRRIKCVCRTCNNEWMAGLQEAAKPFLVPLLTGTPIILHRRAQTTLAAWIAMTIMVAEHVDRGKVAISEAERFWFFKHRRAPRHWRIWIGSHRRQNASMFFHNVLSFVSEEEFKRAPSAATDEANTQTSTVCLGEQLLIHVMSSPIAWSIIR